MVYWIPFSLAWVVGWVVLSVPRLTLHLCSTSTTSVPASAESETLALPWVVVWQ